MLKIVTQNNMAVVEPDTVVIENNDVTPSTYDIYAHVPPGSICVGCYESKERAKAVLRLYLHASNDPNRTYFEFPDK